MLNSIYRVVEQHVWPISFVMLAIVTTASLLPLPALPGVPGSDKTHHLVSYALMALPVALIRPKFWLFFIVFIAVWSGAIELIQPFVNRYGEWLDLLANFLGVFIGCLAGFFTSILLKGQE